MKNTRQFIRKIVDRSSGREMETGISVAPVYTLSGSTRGDRPAQFRAKESIHDCAEIIFREKVTKATVLVGIAMLLIFVCSTVGFAATGEVVYKNIPAPSLGNNLLGTPTTQEIAVYLPPTYKSTESRYPVLYFLSYYNGTIRAWTDGTFQGFGIGPAMNSLLSSGKYRDMMVVIISGRNFLGGGLYVNSPVSGNWEDFIARDVVGYIDSTYRTLPQASSRGLGGFSMGAFGALNIGMHHPNIFSVVYSMSPNLFAPNGLISCALFKSEAFINQYLTKEPQVSTLSALQTYISGCFNNGDIDTPFLYAYGMAFSPDTSRALPHIAYPYTRAGTTLIKNDELWARYERGFGNLEEKVQTWGDSLRHLTLLTIEYGTYDPYSWIPAGCVYFSQLLTAANIPHELTSYAGGHGDQVGTRMTTIVLPYFLKNLAQESNTGVGENRESGDARPQGILPLRNYPNPFNPSTSIQFTLPASGFATLSIYTSTGQKVRNLLAGDLTAGSHTVVWDGRDCTGTPVSSGIYFSLLAAGRMHGVGEMVLIK